MSQSVQQDSIYFSTIPARNGTPSQQFVSFVTFVTTFPGFSTNPFTVSLLLIFETKVWIICTIVVVVVTIVVVIIVVVATRKNTNSIVPAKAIGIIIR